MFKLDLLDSSISEYYDDEMKDANLLSFEARNLNSSYINDYVNNKCFKFYKITHSINRVKTRISNRINEL